MTAKIRSPHPFKERHLFFGGGGSGKTTNCLSVAQHIAVGEMHVIETDLSAAWDRALATDFADIDNVTVYSGEQEWDSFLGRMREVVGEADPAEDWIVVDSSSFSYDAVQDWTLEQLYGDDRMSMLIQLRKEHPTTKEFFAAKSDLMNWDIVKGEYMKFWKLIEKWKGHLILTAEAKATRNQEKDEEVAMMYGPIGFQPVGQARVNHATSTTLFLDHPRRDTWRLTTIKDRNRDRLDKQPIDSFAMDYLVDVAGWEAVRRRAK